MVELVREIDKALSNPVWEQVRRRAPWEETTWEEVADAAIAVEAAALSADPALAREKRRSTQICNCKTVLRGAIEDAISEYGLASVEAISEKTLAATGCGSCQGKLEKILETMDHWDLAFVEATAANPAAQQAA
jgi:nitrogenase molybdenum-cofactor synthesis protein NifE